MFTYNPQQTLGSFAKCRSLHRIVSTRRRVDYLGSTRFPLCRNSFFLISLTETCLSYAPNEKQTPIEKYITKVNEVCKKHSAFFIPNAIVVFFISLNIIKIIFRFSCLPSFRKIFYDKYPPLMRKGTKTIETKNSLDKFTLKCNTGLKNRKITQRV